MHRLRTLLGRRGLALAAVAAVAALTAGCIPQGTHQVSSFGAGGVSPGLWRTLGGSDCTWTWYAEGGAGVIGTNRSFGGPRYAQFEGFGTFDQRGCLPFWQEPGPFAKPLHDPGSATAPIGQGDWAVGYEIRSGTWVGQGAGQGEQCSWERLSGWHHYVTTDEEVVQRGGAFGEAPQIVRVASGDVGFTSDGCGRWLRAYLPAASTGSLVGSWVATSIRSGGGLVGVGPAPSAITIQFGADGRFGGSGGCNGYGGKYATEGGVLALGPIASSLRGCIPGSDQEQVYYADLGATTAFRVSGSTLTLYDGAGSPTAVYGPA